MMKASRIVGPWRASRRPTPARRISKPSTNPASRGPTPSPRRATRASVVRKRRPSSASPRPVATFPLRAAAALFIERQHLDRPRARRLTAASLTRFAEDVGGIQLDSINVVDRAHYLTLWSRFGPYDRGRLDRLVYRRRVLAEYWSHAACLVAASHLPWWRRVMLDYRAKHTGWAKWLKKNGRVMRAVEDAIRARGPLGNADFQHARPPGTSGWWSWKPATFALHFLWMTGRVLIHSRSHFHKRYDLAERVLPGFERDAAPASDEFERWHVRRGLRAMGAATEADLRMYLTFPRGGFLSRKQTLARMLASGEIVEVAIEGDRARWLALAEDLPALARARRRRLPASGTTLLAPFDSLLWYRDRARRLFGFDYRIEVYTPGHKRVHGYYSLPIFHDGQLIGRVDAKNHRAEQRLEVRHVHFEPWLVQGGRPPAASWGDVDLERALNGVAEALWSLADFLGATRVDVVRVTPATLARPLGSAIGSRRSDSAAALAESPAS